MKKLLLALPLFAGVSWAGTTYYSGSQTEPAYNKLLEQLDEASRLSVVSKEYNAGFMQSTAVTEVKFNTKDDSEVLFHLKHDISHSPVNVTPNNARFGAAEIVTTLKMDDIADTELRNFLASFDTGEPFMLTTSVGFDGGTNNALILNSVSYAEDGTSIDYQGGQFDISMDASGAFNGSGIINEIKAAVEDEISVTTAPLTASFQGERLGPMMFNGTTDTALPSVELVMGPTDMGDALTITDISLKTDQQLKGDNTYSKSSVSVGNIENPQFPVKSIRYNTAITGFSAEALKDYADFFAKFKDTDNPMDEQQMLDEGTAVARSLIKPNTAIDLDASATTENGDLAAAVNITFTGNGSADGYEGMVTAGDLARTIAANASIDADTSAVMSLPIGPMLMQPGISDYVQITDEKVTSSAELNNLMLSVNDQQLPLDMMFGDMLELPLAMVLSFIQ